MSISLGLAVLLATQQTRTLVRPIQRITRAARRMTDDSDYAERITGLPNDEIGDLGRAMNSMSARLMDVIKNLRKERDKLGLVISGIGEGLIAVDYKGRVVHYNPVFLELMEMDGIDGLWESDDDNIQALKDLLKRCMDTGEPESMNWQNHTQRALYAGASPLTDDGGEIIGTVCLLRDMSEAMRMEQLRRDYVANISHELRTPLTGIRGMVEPLIDGCMDTEEERQDSYRVILRETIRLEKLVGEMLDMSRLQDGRVSVELEPLELPGILEAAARGMRQIAVDAGVELAVETDGTPLACMGNEDRITQVLVILMDNALSFTPAGGTVTVYARDAGDRVAVGVRDTGCGIEPKDLPLIWERFYKADRSRMRTTGTGLGLSIAKLVVELMGGEIGVNSEPGKGAEFTFTLKKAIAPGHPGAVDAGVGCGLYVRLAVAHVQRAPGICAELPDDPQRTVGGGLSGMSGCSPSTQASFPGRCASHRARVALSTLLEFTAASMPAWPIASSRAGMPSKGRVDTFTWER